MGRKAICLSGQPLDISFHPERPDLVAFALINGSVGLCRLPDDPLALASPLQLRPHRSSCRCIAFDPAHPARLYSGARDGSLAVSLFPSFSPTSTLSSGSELSGNPSAHDSGINAIAAISPHILSTGDDDGVVKLWDNRRGLAKCIAEWSDATDYISDFAFHSPARALLATSGDGTMSIYDVRKPGKPLGLSENQDDELLSVSIVHTTRSRPKVAVGSQSGVVHLFSWGQWLDSTDRFPGHPESVQSLAPLDAAAGHLVSASSDGIVRHISILPNAFIGVVGMREEGMPCEKVAVNAGGRLVASISHDSFLSFWDAPQMQQTQQERVEEEGEQRGVQDAEERELETGDEPVARRKRRKLKNRLVGAEKLRNLDFFKDFD